jgi:hypothetical protein
MTPYDSQGPLAFWRSAVAEKNPLAIGPLWAPKFAIERTGKVVTAGSCFAQYIGRALKANGFNWFDAEPAPPGLPEEDARALNYGIFSFRTGNVYTTALLRQWVAWADGEDVPDEVWENKGRFYDPFRPVVEPNGFGSAEEMRASRRGTVDAIRRAITQASVFVFTLGLTESWLNTSSGVHYPMCPGTTAGIFDASAHAFSNLAYPAVRENLERAITAMRRLNPNLKFLLTVSPVPLTATATDKNVLVATTYSKSTLRAVAGDVAAAHDFVDYFPSYEIITAPPYRGIFFEPNMRSVAPEGVAFVMRNFFECLGEKPHAQEADESTAKAARRARKRARRLAVGNKRSRQDDDVACEDELLDAFGPAA